MAALLAAIAFLGYSLRESNARYRTAIADLSTLHTRLSQQTDPLKNRAEENRSATVPPARVNSPKLDLRSQSATDAELAKERREHAAVEARAKTLEEQLQAASLELENLRRAQGEAGNLRDQLETKLKEAEQATVRVNEEIQKIRGARSEDAMAITTQDLQIRQLTAKLAEQAEMLERERTLLAAGRDIHDLMGARNLHIVDVFDVDSKGKDKRAFGRVFYTEEKSLIFYAFDLADRNTTKRNASFQVWGASGPKQTPTKSLGIFYIDDQKQNRWVLKFEDPAVLAEIDSVFVTIEPPGGSLRPTSPKFLYAYLRANANHP